MIDDEDFMRDEYTKKDVCNIRKNPFVGKFTVAEKFRAYVAAFIADNKWNKEEAKKEMDLFLAA